MKSRIVIFEAGGTKTEIRSDLNPDKSVVISGYNPNRHSEFPFNEIQEDLKIGRDTKLFFYGAGFSNQNLANSFKRQLELKYNCSVEVYGDLMGAARALFNDQPGAMAIMGTGGVVAYYNGQNIVDVKGGYGYLVDDLGGGFEFGRWLISDWLNDSLTFAQNNHLSELVNVAKENVIQEIYHSSSPTNYISGITGVVLRDNTMLYANILDKYYEQFIRKHVLPIMVKFEARELRIAGSFGYFTKTVFEEALLKFNIKLGACLKAPSQELLKYHLDRI